ncbi:MAG: acyl--CoA ligase [Ignavibacteriales bacterium]|nr:acyl--CoA ligase [Ignavibacteriales bacterium]
MPLKTNFKDYWIESQAFLHPERTAVIYGETSISYSQLMFASENLVKKISPDRALNGKIVFLACGHDIQFIIYLLALWKTGAIVFPVSSKIKKKEIESLITEFGDQIFICDNDFEIPATMNKMILQNEFDFNETNLTDSQYNGVSLIIGTSGSTGKPKGVLHSYESLFSSFIAFRNLRHNSPAPHLWFASLPFHHIGGFSIITRTILAGDSVIIPENNSTDGLLVTLIEKSPDYISLVPTVLEKLVSSKLEPTCRKTKIFLGGAKSKFQTVKNADKLGWDIELVYGSSETGSMICSVHSSDSEFTEGFIGKPLPGIEISVVGNDGKSLESGEKGKMLISSPTLFHGYFVQTKNLTESFQKNEFLTSDLGWKDSNDSFHLVGRADNLIISGGMNIDPEEIESLIKSIPGVADCAIFPVNDDYWGQIVAAIIEPVKNSSLGKDNVLQLLRTNLSGYKLPKKIVFSEKIPRTDLGKIIYNNCLAILREDEEPDYF